MQKTITPRPFLKWAGGKTRLRKALLANTPKKFEDYYEPFLGGGAFFFTLYREQKLRQAYLSDLNEELINAYIIVRDQVSKLIKLLSTYPYDEKFYYKKRAEAPEEMQPVERAARLIYLNKTCYNGLYRVNQQGIFNVPFGRYKSPTICDKKNLQAVSEALSSVQIECLSFKKIVERANPDDFVYFDPPYEPLSKTAKFTSYQASGFGQDAQLQLQQICHALSGRKVHFMLSNSSADLIKELYNANDFYIQPVETIRSINSNAQKRGKLTELIVTNYNAEGF